MRAGDLAVRFDPKCAGGWGRSGSTGSCWGRGSTSRPAIPSPSSRRAPLGAYVDETIKRQAPHEVAQALLRLRAEERRAGRRVQAGTDAVWPSFVRRAR